MSSLYPFERFTLQSRQVLTRAQEEAERSHHSYIDTEHLLLGLFQVQGGMASLILADLGAEIRSVRETIKKVLGRNERILIQQVVPTSRVKRVIEIAFEEARQSGSSSVGTHHLLLALMIEGEGIAAHVLADLRVTEARVREAIDRLSAQGLQEDPGSEAPLPPPPTSAMGRGPGDPRRMARTLDDLAAVELLAALLDRFGATDPPPPPLLRAVAELRRARERKQAAIAAQDYEAAKRHHDDELRLEADARTQLEAWRHHR